MWFHVRRCSSVDGTYYLHYRNEFKVLWNRILKVLIWVGWAELSYQVEQLMVNTLPVVWQLSGFENTAFRAVYLTVLTAEVRSYLKAQSFSISQRLLFWSQYYYPRDHYFLVTEVHIRKSGRWCFKELLSWQVINRCLGSKLVSVLCGDTSQTPC